MLSKGEKNMNKVAIMTDSNSGISLQQAKEMNCFMLNMPIILNQNTYNSFCVEHLLMFEDFDIQEV